MLTRPPPDDEAKRRANRKAVAEHRARRRKDVIVFPGRLGPGAINAMAARNRYLGKSREEAERLARDPEEIAKVTFEVMEKVWARGWFDLMKRK